MILIRYYYLVSNIFIVFIKTFLDKSDSEHLILLNSAKKTTEYNLQKRQLFVIDLILIKSTKI